MAWDDESVAPASEETLREVRALLREVLTQLNTRMDLLTDEMRIARKMEHTRLDLICEELQAFRRGKTPKSIYPQETPAELCSAICKYVFEHYQEHGIPFHSGKISRVFSHRLRRHGRSVAEILRPAVPETLYMFTTDKGATVYLPKAAWDSASQEQRDRWYIMSEHDHYRFKEDHRKMILEFQRNEAEIERKAAEYKKRLQDIAATGGTVSGAHGLPESEEAFSDLTDSKSSDK